MVHKRRLDLHAVGREHAYVLYNLFGTLLCSTTQCLLMVATTVYSSAKVR